MMRGMIALLIAASAVAGNPVGDRDGNPLPAGAIARLGSLRLRHAAHVNCLTFTRDAKHIIAGSRLGDVRIWDVDSGREVRSLPGHRLGVNCLTVSLDGKFLVSTGGEPSVRIHDLAGGRDRVLADLRDAVWSAALSSDGKTLALGVATGKAILYDLATDRVRFEVGSYQAGVYSVALSPDGKMLATAGVRDCGVRLWDAHTGQQRLVLIEEDPITPSVAFSPDGKMLITVGSRMRQWDVRTGEKKQMLAKIEDGLPTLAVAPDGRAIAVAGVRGTSRVRLFDPQGVRQPVSLPGGDWGACSLAYSPDGQRLALGTFEGAIRIIDLKTSKDLHPGAGHRAPLTGIAFAPDGKMLATAGGRTVCLWDPVRATARLELEHPDGAFSVAFSADGRVVASGGGGDTERRICLWKAQLGEQLELISYRPTLENVRSLAYSPDGRWLCWSGAAKLCLWNVAQKVERSDTDPEWSGAQAVAFSSDSRGFAIADAGNALRLWTLEPLRHRLRFGKHQGAITGLVFSPDGQMLATSSKDGTVRAWDAFLGKELFRLPAHDGVGAVVFSKDGQFLFSGGTDGKIRLWHVFTASLVRTWEGHRAEVTGLALSPDGHTLASASADSTALLWRIEERDLKGPPPRVLTAEELERLWTSLSSEDGTEGYRAVGTLALAPDQAGAFLDERLKAVLPSPPQVRQWIADLDARRFRTRAQAQQELERWGHLTMNAVEEVMKDTQSLEVRRRAAEVLQSLKDRPQIAELVRLQRSLRILELSGSAKARAAIERLVALDIPGAKAAMERIKERKR